MQISKDDYFFFEWLILCKGMNESTFSELTASEVTLLRTEWIEWFDKQ